jgi:hypothetical protein
VRISSSFLPKLISSAPRFRRPAKRQSISRQISRLRSEIEKEVERKLQGPALLLDEALRFISMLETYLYTQERHQACTPFLLLLARLRSDLLSIRVLIFHGQESSALAVSRVFVEDIELAMAVVADPAFGKEYMNTSDPGSLWSKQVGYGKINARIRQFVQLGRGSATDAESVVNHHRDLKTFLSAHVHPTFSSAFRLAYPAELAQPGLFRNRPLGTLGEYLAPLCVYLADDVQVLSATCITALVRPNPPAALADLKPNEQFDDMISAAHVLQGLTRRYSRRFFSQQDKKRQKWEEHFRAEQDET